MKRNKVGPTDFDIFIANISPMLEGLNDQVATLARLLSACREKIKDDSDLKDRMALIDELYSHADSEDHAAARFAELVADRVYEYENETVLIPYSSQSQALAFLMDERGIKQKDLSAIATQSAISEILNDKRKMTVAQVKKFSDFFKVPAEFFMQGVV
ncbi:MULTISPECIES: type II toxin-antitoxin system HigA family antitoxin [unclassified Pseudomonas]|uniref:helix-turn-helix domain-containing protein n=1 Tax=unclassified Pseudomonas TaxID=196821 RepID=UPI000C2FD4FB|nr:MULTISPECIES: helix-turn-helix domain-containing protein [unclassified Pseudomonas]MCU1740490.1 helix-turn-helix domain-containing protein [Pseudomonas sp. 20S_6.2_Bac1]